VYSPWLWLYFLVTIILNLTVFFGTYYLWRKKELEIMAWDKDQEAQNVETPVVRLDGETKQYVEQEIGHAAPGAKVPTASEHAQSSRRPAPYTPKTEASS
jgi:hypothetical protein